MADWTMLPVILDTWTLSAMRSSDIPGPSNIPSVYQGEVVIQGEPQDTYLDMSLWTKVCLTKHWSFSPCSILSLITMLGLQYSKCRH